MGQRRHSILDVLTSALLYATMMVGGIYLYIFVDQTVERWEMSEESLSASARANNGVSNFSKLCS